jgi:hypothetical protein
MSHHQQVWQILAHQYYGILLNNKNKWPIDICNNMDGSQNHAKQNKLDQNKVHIPYDLIYINSRKWEVIYSDRKQARGLVPEGTNW